MHREEAFGLIATSHTTRQRVGNRSLQLSGQFTNRSSEHVYIGRPPTAQKPLIPLNLWHKSMCFATWGELSITTRVDVPCGLQKIRQTKAAILANNPQNVHRNSCLLGSLQLLKSAGFIGNCGTIPMVRQFSRKCVGAIPGSRQCSAGRRERAETEVSKTIWAILQDETVTAVIASTTVRTGPRFVSSFRAAQPFALAVLHNYCLESEAQ